MSTNKFDKKLGACVPKGRIAYAYPFFVGNRKSDDTDNNQQPSNGQNGQKHQMVKMGHKQVMDKHQMVNTGGRMYIYLQM